MAIVYRHCVLLVMAKEGMILRALENKMRKGEGERLSQCIKRYERMGQ